MASTATAPVEVHRQEKPTRWLQGREKPREKKKPRAKGNAATHDSNNATCHQHHRSATHHNRHKESTQKQHHSISNQHQHGISTAQSGLEEPGRIIPCACVCVRAGAYMHALQPGDHKVKESSTAKLSRAAQRAQRVTFESRWQKEGTSTRDLHKNSMNTTIQVRDEG
jgi:hypothetical protein